MSAVARVAWLAVAAVVGGLAGSTAAADDSQSAAEAEDTKSERDPATFNEFDFKYLTLRIGGGLLVDTARYSQDDDSETQMMLDSDIIVRDLRLLLKGRFTCAPRLSYTIGYMYDGQTSDWRFRQTGLMIDVPELNGRLFIGRTKEGFSTNKLMVGYHGWANERAAANDAFLPILADGVKWTGDLFDGHIVYNLGVFDETITAKQSYRKNDRQAAARVVWLPLGSTLHLAVEGRYGASLDGHLQYRSKPESNAAQEFAVDTGEFTADGSTMAGIEAYYRPGALMFGMEYFFNQVQSPENGDPFFHGGEIFAAYVITGEVRPYNAKGAYFEAISPERPVFSGGPGAWELVLRYSYVDLDSGPIRGGTFQRITPMVNWHLSDNMRLELVYGYGLLDRFGVEGGTHFFQSRIQFTLN